MNDQRSTAEPTSPIPIQSVIRAVRTVIRAEVRMRVEGTGDISPVERAHTRLENAVRRVPNSALPEREKKLLVDDVKRLGEID